MDTAVFLDRDGVINPLVYNLETGEYESPHIPDDFSIYPSASGALKLLKEHGFYTFIISNQPSYAKGKTSLENIKAIEKQLRDHLEESGLLIDKYYYCYHHPHGIVPEYSIPCGCRKPGTLFVKQAAEEFGLDLKKCFFVGDQDTDIRCGKTSGMTTVKINNKHSTMKSGRENPDVFAKDVYDAAKKIINWKGRNVMDEVYVAQYLKETSEIVSTINQVDITKVVRILRGIKIDGGRLFILGVGGSAANASHAVNDFRKIAHIEAYAPTDNVSELTARVNDEGWETTFDKWLDISRLNERDAVLVLSVGGGSHTTSLNIKKAVDLVSERGAKITAIVSRDGGYAKEKADACVLIPVVADERITAHAEGWQGIVWHLIVNAIASADHQS